MAEKTMHAAWRTPASLFGGASATGAVCSASLDLVCRKVWGTRCVCSKHLHRREADIYIYIIWVCVTVKYHRCVGTLLIMCGVCAAAPD